MGCSADADSRIAGTEAARAALSAGFYCHAEIAWTKGTVGYQSLVVLALS